MEILFLLFAGVVLILMGVVYAPELFKREEKDADHLAPIVEGRHWLGVFAVVVSIFLGLKVFIELIDKMVWIFLFVAAAVLFIGGLVLASPLMSSSSSGVFKRFAALAASLEDIFQFRQNGRVVAVLCILSGILVVLSAVFVKYGS